jgi:mRNA-degrading endonuclease toxin of MazEF toxin-antitoxin module
MAILTLKIFDSWPRYPASIVKIVVVIPLTTTATPAAAPLMISLPSAGATKRARIDNIRAIDKSRVLRLSKD